MGQTHRPDSRESIFLLLSQSLPEARQVTESHRSEWTKKGLVQVYNFTLFHPPAFLFIEERELVEEGHIHKAFVWEIYWGKHESAAEIPAGRKHTIQSHFRHR